MILSKFKKLLIIGIPTSLLVGVVVLFLIIYIPVKELVDKAQSQYKGDYVESLILYLDSDEQNFKEKNHIIWALGEIGDKRALPVLQQLYTGQECDKPCSSDKYICQYQLQKSIEFCNSNLVISKSIRFFLEI